MQLLPYQLVGKGHGSSFLGKGDKFHMVGHNSFLGKGYWFHTFHGCEIDYRHAVIQ